MVLFGALYLLCHVASAMDNRIKIISYHENEVVLVRVAIFTTLQIVFSKEEVIRNIQNGDLAAWTASVQEQMPNMIFLKPTLVGSHTNMTVVTDQRVYYFQLESQDNDKADDNTYAIRFHYPQYSSARPILSRSDHHNWNYSYSGDKALLPVRVYDDGKFTYMQFRDNQFLPAIFVVDNAEGKEAVVNFRRQGKYVVIKQTAPQFSLRQGQSHVASIFNQPLIREIARERG